MALKLSTGLRNYLLSMASMRKAFENGVMKIYSGSAPSTADLAPTGTLLCNITKSSGTVSASETAEGKISVFIVTTADLLTTVTLAGTGYTINSAGATMAKDLIAIAMAQLINRTCPECIAIANGTSANGTFHVMSRIEGQTFTSANTANCTMTDTVAATREDTIQFAAAASGAIAKNADVWSGVNVETNTAGYFRLVTSGDLGTNNATDLRLQGTCNTSGADLNMSNISLVTGATTTVDTFELTLPAS